VSGISRGFEDELVFRRDSSSAVEPATCTRARRRPPWRGRRRAGPRFAARASPAGRGDAVYDL
jgi:hypothetical protein